MSRILPRFVTPSDVADLKTRLDPSVRALDDAVERCKEAIGEPTRKAWRDFSAAWRNYFETENSWLHCAAQYDNGEAYEKQIADWQRLIATTSCRVAGPVLPSPTAAVDSFQDTVRTVAIAGAVIVAVIGLRSVVR